MKITGIETWRQSIPLSRPYTIAFRTTDAVENFFVRLLTDSGLEGLGCAAPEPHVTGEDADACDAALQAEGFEWLKGGDPRELPHLCRVLATKMKNTPAARAAIDMALHDLLARHLGLPLVKILGQVYRRLPTSITIGIKSVEEMLEEADEYIGRGFRILKVKTGDTPEADIERLSRLREHVGRKVLIRVDPNQAYDPGAVRRFFEGAARLDLEFLEQPMPISEDMRSLAEAERMQLAADESLLDESDALALAAEPKACGIFNIKLMKCGGISAGRRIADIAETAGIDLMWGCMDESRISISAALHAALACPATRYLDLDGHLDLAEDPATGGFTLENGWLTPTDAPGLGLRLASA
jgi:L-Ala-D/L-Glu epimerase